MFGITDLPAYLIGTAIIIVLPGPNSLFCLSVSARYGRRAGYRCAAGILLGDALLMLATALGAGTLLKHHPALFDGIRLLGSLYMAYIGIRLLRAAAQTLNGTADNTDTGTAARPTRPFVRALILSLTNPKAILFFLSFFVQFADPAYPNPALTFLALALILQAFSFCYLNLLIAFGRGLRQTFGSRKRLAAGGMAAAGCLFFGFAAKLWTGI